MKKVVAICLFILLICISFTRVNADSADDLEEYCYGDFVWHNYSFQQQIELCRITAETTAAMNTRMLLYAVLDYPLWPMIYAYDSLEIGFHNLYYACDALRELLKRPDGMQELSNLMIYLNSEEDNSNYSLDYRGKNISKYFVQCLVSGTYRMLFSQEYSKETDNRGSRLYVYTPKGTPVYYEDNTDLIQWDDLQKVRINTWVQSHFTSVEVIGAPNKYYNCHSYAWYFPSTNNTAWISDPSAYMNDGSYYISYSPSANYIVYYHNNGLEVGLDGEIIGDHSGIIDSISGSTIKVVSKWGQLGLYRHNIYDSLYSGNNTQYSYWELDEE